MSGTWMAILGGAVLTYATRTGGYLILSRYPVIPPRLSAALNAVPAAVLTSLVAPAALTQGWPEVLTMIIAILAALRLPILATFAVSWAAIVLLRQML